MKLDFKNRMRTIFITIFLFLYICISYWPITCIADINEYKVSHNISINLNGGDCDYIGYISCIDHGKDAGEFFSGLCVGKYLADKYDTYHTVFDYDTPIPVVNGTISGFYDCVGLTPYVDIRNVHREGYTFSGWTISGSSNYSDSDLSDIMVEIGAYTDEDINITANWTKNPDPKHSLTVRTYYLDNNIWRTDYFSKYSSIKLYVNNDSYDVKGQFNGYFPVNSKYNIFLEVHKDYEIDYKMTSKLSGELDSDTTISIYLRPKSLVAYYISYVPEKYIFSTEEFDYNLPIQLNNLSNKPKDFGGFSFYGWGLNVNKPKEILNITQQGILPRKEDLYIYALWNYTIIYEPNCDDYTGLMESVKTPLNMSVTISDNEFERANYIFTEWNTKPDGSGISINPNDDKLLYPEINGYLHLYAQWKPAKIKLIFDSNKPANSSEDLVYCNNSYTINNDGFYETYFDYVENLASLPFPSIFELYSIRGWTPLEWEIINYDPENFTLLLQARWTENSYTVVFNTNKGYSIEPINVSYETEFALPKEPERPGHNFQYWSSYFYGTEVRYSANQIVKKLSDVDNDTVIINAIWNNKNKKCLLINTDNYTLIDNNYIKNYKPANTIIPLDKFLICFKPKL